MSEPTFKNSDMVFWCTEPQPYWVIEWQPENGEGCYWLVDAKGQSATATENELSFRPGETQ